MNVFKLLLAEQKTGLNPTRAAILETLRTNGPMPSGKLGRCVFKSAVVVGGIIKTMEAADLVTITRSDRDRRVVIITPTILGLRTLEDWTHTASAF